MSDTLTVFDEIESDFLNYVECFLDAEEEPEFRQLMELKREHSLQVSALAGKIAESEGFDTQTLLLCRVAGLLHDLGRFEQINVFGTLDDLKSIDHGNLGYDVLSNTGFLEYFRTPEQLALLFAVRNHNKRNITDYPDELTETITKTVRDADKLDVYRVMHNSLNNGNNQHKNAVLLQLEDASEISPEVFQSVEEQKTVNKNFLKTTTDFHVMQLSWAFDMNFKSSMKMLQKSEDMQCLMDRISGTERASIIKNIVNQYISSNI
jgi:putative nucleotidyltransferase with HDIG domain